MEKIQIRIPDVLAMLNAGKSREEIGQHYGLNGANTKALFNEPELKGKKAKKQRPFMIVREEQEDVTAAISATEQINNVAQNEVENIQEEVATSESNWAN